MKNGHVTERLGAGLQNLLRQFDPARGLMFNDFLYGKQSKRGGISILPFFLYMLKHYRHNC